MKYTDPDGRILDTSKVSPEDLEVYKNQRTKLMEIDRSRKVIMELEASPEIFTIEIGYGNTFQDDYNFENKTIYWNPCATATTSIDSGLKNISETTMLFHEMGHAYQDMNGELKNPKECTQYEILLMEQANLEQNEQPVANALGDGVKTNYLDWDHIEYKYQGKDGSFNKVWSSNIFPISDVDYFYNSYLPWINGD